MADVLWKSETDLYHFLFSSVSLSLNLSFHSHSLFHLSSPHGSEATDEDPAQWGGTMAWWVDPWVPPSIATCVSQPPVSIVAASIPLTPKPFCGCMRPWAPRACSLYMVRGCKSLDCLTASTPTPQIQLRTQNTLPQQTANWLRGKKHTQKNTHTDTDTYTQTVHNNRILMKAWCGKRERVWMCVCVCVGLPSSKFDILTENAQN